MASGVTNVVSVAALVGAVAILVFVFYWSGRYGGRGMTGTSLRRGPRSHTTARGRPKVGYDRREDAEAQARVLAKRAGAPMNVYQCIVCAKWHVGHGR